MQGEVVNLPLQLIFKELVEVNGFEPMTSCVQSRRSSG